VSIITGKAGNHPYAALDRTQNAQHSSGGPNKAHGRGVGARRDSEPRDSQDGTVDSLAIVAWFYNISQIIDVLWGAGFNIARNEKKRRQTVHVRYHRLTRPSSTCIPPPEYEHDAKLHVIRRSHSGTIAYGSPPASATYDTVTEPHASGQLVYSTTQ
jgi:hypothetical protein